MEAATPYYEFDDISQIGKYRVGRVFGVGIGVGSRCFVFIGFEIFVRSMIGIPSFVT